MPTGIETEEQAQERLINAAEARYGKAVTKDEAEKLQVETAKKESLRLMRAELQAQDNKDGENRMNALERIGAVVKVAAKKTVEDRSDVTIEHVQAQVKSTEKVVVSTALAAGALVADAGIDGGTAGFTALPFVSHIKDQGITEVANKAWEAATGEKKMTNAFDETVSFFAGFVPGLNSFVNPIVVAAARISVEEKVNMTVRDVKLAAGHLGSIVGNLRGANEALNQVTAENRRNTTQETAAGNMQTIGAAA